MKSDARADVSIPGFQHENFRRDNEQVAMGGAHRIRPCGNGCGCGSSIASANRKGLKVVERCRM